MKHVEELISPSWTQTHLLYLLKNAKKLKLNRPLSIVVTTQVTSSPCCNQIRYYRSLLREWLSQVTERVTWPYQELFSSVKSRRMFKNAKWRHFSRNIWWNANKKHHLNWKSLCKFSDKSLQGIYLSDFHANMAWILVQLGTTITGCFGFLTLFWLTVSLLAWHFIWRQLMEANLSPQQLKMASITVVWWCV